MKSKTRILFTLTILLFSISLAAQQEKNVPIGFNLQLKNMHLWRGLQVSNEVTLGSDLYFTDKSQAFKLGIWGGAGISGKYKEFDYYASYQHKGFQISVWDIYNFSKDATYNNSEVFNYKAHETGHFVDVSVGYTFQGKFPLSLSWSTVIFGRDRGATNKENLYSTYVYASYPILKDKFIDLEVGLAGAFALNAEEGTSANFYASSAGIVNISLTASKKIEFGKYTLPISVMGMWNPKGNNANLQIALDLLTF